MYSMSVAELPISIDREKLAAFCRARGIRKLSIFGSILRHDFDPVRSDVDMLAELLPAARPGWSRAWRCTSTTLIGWLNARRTCAPPRSKNC